MFLVKLSGSQSKKTKSMIKRFVKSGIRQK